MAPLSHRHDPDTSRAAARSVEGSARCDRDRVLRAYRVIDFHRSTVTIYEDGMTADECAALLGWDKVERARRRCSELKSAGKLIDTKKRRPTASGRMQAVLRVKPPGGQGVLFS